MSQIGLVFTIVDGPAKWDLLTAFGDAKSGQTVEFKYYGSDGRFNLRTGATILTLSHADHSGHSWNFVAIVKMPGDRAGQISGYYNTQTRNGNFTIVA